MADQFLSAIGFHDDTDPLEEHLRQEENLRNQHIDSIMEILDRVLISDPNWGVVHRESFFKKFVAHKRIVVICLF